MNDPNKTLVIVDMQEKFMHAEETYEIIPNICFLVEHAIYNNWPIIVVEYNGWGDTNLDIRETIGEYPHQKTIIKNDCDGGQKVIDYINNTLWPLNFVVCGIFGDMCVPLTVIGLFNNSNLVEVDVVTDAIYPEYSSSSRRQEKEITTSDIGISVTAL